MGQMYVDWVGVSCKYDSNCGAPDECCVSDERCTKCSFPGVIVTCLVVFCLVCAPLLLFIVVVNICTKDLLSSDVRILIQHLYIFITLKLETLSSQDRRAFLLPRTLLSKLRVKFEHLLKLNIEIDLGLFLRHHISLIKIPNWKTPVSQYFEIVPLPHIRLMSSSWPKFTLVLTHLFKLIQIYLMVDLHHINSDHHIQGQSRGRQRWH